MRPNQRRKLRVLPYQFVKNAPLLCPPVIRDMESISVRDGLQIVASVCSGSGVIENNDPCEAGPIIATTISSNRLQRSRKHRSAVACKTYKYAALLPGLQFVRFDDTAT